MSVRAPVGPVNIATQKICIGQGVVLQLFAQGKKLNKKGNNGVVFDSINKEQIENIKIPLPPLETQCEIVAKLDKQMEALEGVRLLKSEVQKRIEEILAEAWGR